MKIHRFFVEKPLGGEKQISVPNGELFHQLKDVLRFQIGAELVIFDNTGFEYQCHLLGFERGEVQLQVVGKKENARQTSRELYLFFSLIKKDNAEWVIEKGTELGVSHFIPILSARSEKKSLNFERVGKIVKEAAEQSGKSVLPQVHAIQSIEDAFKNFSLHFIALDPKGRDFSKEPFGVSPKVGIFVGPEGGWTPGELTFFKKNKIPVLSLGKQILRAETASIAVSALLLL